MSMRKYKMFCNVGASEGLLIILYMFLCLVTFGIFIPFAFCNIIKMFVERTEIQEV